MGSIAPESLLDKVQPKSVLEHFKLLVMSGLSCQVFGLMLVQLMMNIMLHRGLFSLLVLD